MIKLTVVYVNGDMGGDSTPRIKTYKGKDEVEVLRKITNAHSYELFDDDEDFPTPTTARGLYNRLMSLNGDGCDYIAAIFEGDVKKYKPKAKAKNS